MLFTTRNTLCCSAIALGLMTVNMGLLHAQAESETIETTENISFEDIEAGNNGRWNFSSEDEAISIEDNLQELKEYDISTPYDSDWRLTEEERRWGNMGNRPDYTLETEIYNY